MCNVNDNLHPTCPCIRLRVNCNGKPQGGLGSNYARMCVSRTWVLFQLQASEMSKNCSLKKGVKFAASLNMGENLC